MAQKTAILAELGNNCLYGLIYQFNVEELKLEVLRRVGHGYEQTMLSVASDPDVTLPLATRYDLGLMKDLKKCKEDSMAAGPTKVPHHDLKGLKKTQWVWFELGWGKPQVLASGRG